MQFLISILYFFSSLFTLILFNQSFMQSEMDIGKQFTGILINVPQIFFLHIEFFEELIRVDVGHDGFGGVELIFFDGMVVVELPEQLAIVEGVKFLDFVLGIDKGIEVAHVVEFFVELLLLAKVLELELVASFACDVLYSVFDGDLLDLVFHLALVLLLELVAELVGVGGGHHGALFGELGLHGVQIFDYCSQIKQMIAELLGEGQYGMESALQGVFGVVDDLAAFFELLVKVLQRAGHIDHADFLVATAGVVQLVESQGEQDELVDGFLVERVLEGAVQFFLVVGLVDLVHLGLLLLDEDGELLLEVVADGVELLPVELVLLVLVDEVLGVAHLDPDDHDLVFLERLLGVELVHERVELFAVFRPAEEHHDSGFGAVLLLELPERLREHGGRRVRGAGPGVDLGVVLAEVPVHGGDHGEDCLGGLDAGDHRGVLLEELWEVGHDPELAVELDEDLLHVEVESRVELGLLLLAGLVAFVVEVLVEDHAGQLEDLGGDELEHAQQDLLLLLLQQEHEQAALVPDFLHELVDLRDDLLLRLGQDADRRLAELHLVVLQLAVQFRQHHVVPELRVRVVQEDHVPAPHVRGRVRLRHVVV